MNVCITTTYSFQVVWNLLYSIYFPRSIANCFLMMYSSQQHQHIVFPSYPIKNIPSPCCVSNKLINLIHWSYQPYYKNINHCTVIPFKKKNSKHSRNNSGNLTSFSKYLWNTPASVLFDSLAFIHSIIPASQRLVNQLRKFKTWSPLKIITNP